MPYDRDVLSKEIRQIVHNRMDFRKEPEDGDIRDLIAEVVLEKSKTTYLGLEEKKELSDAVFNAMRRLDVLQPLLEDDSVTEIMVNGFDCIHIERHGKVHRHEKTFSSREKLEDVIQSIVAKVNRSVNEACPIVDARLKDGSRVSVVLAPIALNGPILTIRKFPDKPMTMQQLEELGSVTPEAAELLGRMVRARYNLFVSGGTGAGKTTFLNALSGFIPSDERIITIEDSAELQITSVENLVRLETRNANTEGKGEVNIRDLIRASLRMRPERIIVGEVRGGEALDMLNAMNTGHDGSLSTGHANSASDMLARLETMVLCGAQLPLEAIRQQIASAIDVMVHLSRLRDKSRRIMEITEVAGYAGGCIRLNPLFVFVEEGEDENGRILGSLHRTENRMIHTRKFEMAGINSQM